MTKTLPKSKVPWCTHSWPILRGCSAISAGCEHCYAASWHHRFAKHMGVEPWGRPYFLPEHYGMPLGTKKPALVFVAPMSDLGHDLVDELWLWEIACAMRAAPQHQYIVLTKRPGPWLRELPPECWVGVSIESDAPEIKARWQQLLGWCWPGAPVKFVSVEPMLGPVSFQFAFKPDWVIVGPETGPKARPCRSEWIDALAAESPVFFDKRKDWKRREYPI